MQFINPVEILELDTSEISAVDNSLIKKAKRKLFADIDLSDNGHFEYKGLSLQEACEFVVNDKLKKFGGEGGLVAINKNGDCVLTFNSDGMYRAWKTSDESNGVEIYK